MSFFIGLARCNDILDSGFFSVLKTSVSTHIDRRRVWTVEPADGHIFFR